MPKYTKNFMKKVWGFATVTADSKEEAQELFDNYDLDDEFDNESEYEWDPEVIDHDI